MMTDTSAHVHIKKVDALFENLVSLPELQLLLQRWLKKEFKRDTIYRWVKKGMPHEKIRGDLYFPPEEVAIWLKRTS